MASRKRGLLSGGAKNPKPKPSASGSTQLTLTSSILKSQPVSTSSSRRRDSPDLFDVDDDGDVEILEPTPKRRQLRLTDSQSQATASVSSGVSTRTRQRSSQMSMAMAPPATSAASRSTATQRSAGNFFTPREKPTPTKRRPQTEPDDTVYQSVKKAKISSSVPEDDGLEVVMKLRSHPPTKTFQKAAQGSHRSHTNVSQPILCSQMSTWSISS
uniref:Shugoshin_C domain-containing protein n=1 Tax=Panagrellus redivivus TaxID=6233 RepID=A0A7E4ZRN3_PANRE